MNVPNSRFHWIIVFVLVGSGESLAQAPAAREGNFDRRAGMAISRTVAPAAATAQMGAIDALRADLGGSLVHALDAQTGVTRTLYNPVGYLTAERSGDATQIALDFVRSNLPLLGLAPGDLDEYQITDTVYSAVTGVTHVYLRQQFLDLPVFNAQLQIHVNRDGRISGVQNGFVPNLARLARSAVPVTRAGHAVASAARHLGRPMAALPRVLRSPVGVRQRTMVSATALSSEAVDAELTWLPVGRDLRLVWRFQLHTPDGQHIYDMTVDAEGGALSLDDPRRVFTRFDWVSSSQYQVYALPVESPNHTSPSPPADARIVVANPEDGSASPNGWHDAGTTLMDGNNVHAYLDRNGNNAPDAGQPSCGSGLDCSFPINLSADPVNYTSAAVANLFYWNNVIHDVQYQYGFDEAGGNFQESNFGRGGSGSDSVNAEGQDNADGTSRCNANFATPPDGGNPRMQMFVCNNTSPQRDGDFDNGVIVHEYGHGISIRQVGGPSNSSCLNNNQQGGEGWSDFFALVYTAQPGDAGIDARGVGSYLFGLATDGSIRPQRYSTDPAINNYTYESINGLSIPHGVGSVWAQALWEVYWALVDQHGFDPDLYNALGGAGNQRALLYVNEGLKNTACSPTFTEARDGIIQAATDSFGGEDVCLLWETFAAFGLGVDAVSGGSNSTNPTNGFDIPASCAAPLPAPACPAGTIDFSSFALEAYSNQDASGTVSVEHGGDTLFMEGNRWRRSVQSFDVAANTVIEFLFQSSSQGEIHGIGFDEDQTLSNNQRIFQFWGTQNWSGAIQFTPRYTAVGDFQSFTIPVGDFYTGSNMRLVFVNDKDAGSANNLGRFACVDIVSDMPPPNTPPAVTITAPADGATFDEGVSVSFTATANDAEDGDLSGSLGWSSSLDGAFGSGGSVSTSTLSVGVHTITASVDDSGGLTGSDSISVTIDAVGGGCADCIDWSTTPTVAYSNQDGSGSIEIQDGGDTFFMAGNRWRRTTQTFTVTPFTVIEFDFMSTSQGEIHGIGFDEDDGLTNGTRIFEIFGTQNWGGAFQVADKYTTGELGSFRSFRIEVGQFYTGSAMFLVVVNDKDAGSPTNTSSFRNVRVFEETPPGCGTILHSSDFETGANGWFHSAANSTCSTGFWGVGNPDGVVNGGVTTQLENDHTASGVNAFFTEPNTFGAGTNDVDGGVCTALSPVVDASGLGSAQISFWYYHGQRDAGDDPSGDFFRIDLSNDGGATFPTNLVSIGDATSNAAWTQVSTTVTSPGQLRLRVQASDGAGPGDLVEGGLDDVLICIPTPLR